MGSQRRPTTLDVMEGRWVSEKARRSRMRGALISLHVEKVTPLVLWIATPRKRCPGGWYLGAVHRFYTYMDPTCLRYGGLT